jgi:hypothetical protein
VKKNIEERQTKVWMFCCSLFDSLMLCVLFQLFSVIASSVYEKASILFSIAALQTQLADSQNMSTDDGLKTAAKLLQVIDT